MKVHPLALMLVAMGGIVACDKNENKNSTAVRDASYQNQKDATINQANEDYKKSLDSELNDYETKLARWKDEASTAAEPAKTKMDQAIAGLEKSLASAKDGLKDLKSSAASTWETVKAKTDSAFQSLKKGFQDAAANFKEAVTPK